MLHIFPGLVLWVWIARRGRGSVMALFSLFEKAMLSASQNDITLCAPYWSPGMNRPYLKKQSAHSLCWWSNMSWHKQCSSHWRCIWADRLFMNNLQTCCLNAPTDLNTFMWKWSVCIKNNMIFSGVLSCWCLFLTVQPPYYTQWSWACWFTICLHI